jgi:hypothetical protein
MDSQQMVSWFKEPKSTVGIKACEYSFFTNRGNEMAI